MKIDFRPTRPVLASIKAIAFTALVTGVYWATNTLLKAPMSADSYCITLATCSIFLHFYDKEDKKWKQ